MSANAVERLAVALGEAVGTDVALERPSDPSHGDYATNAAMRLAPVRRRPPRELGEEIASAAVQLDDVERAEVAGPGFVNLWLADEWYARALEEILRDGDRYGAGDPQPRQRIQVEMVSANPTGPITVASARNGAYGDSVARLLEFAGHEVEREYYYNDAGAQMDRFRASVDAARRGEEPPEDGYRGDYVRELAEVEGDPVPPMLERIQASLERFRIHFDAWARQSELEQRLPEFLPRLPTYVRDGAVWVRSKDHGDDDDKVIVRSPEKGGSPTYRAADVVYLADKLSRGFDRLIYVLGADHHGTRNWYAAVARMLGLDPERVEVLLYQLVHLTRGGEQAKMSKRRGDVVFLDELLDEVGVDAARWYLVDRGPDQTIEIDVDLAAERSRKNPVYYVQYVHARTAGIRREAGDARPDPAPPGPLSREERDLVKRLADFPLTAALATHRRAPHLVAYYAIQLADDFHRFYHDHRVIDPETRAVNGFRLGLVVAVQAVTARSLDLLGVEAPERM
jgi:arginyl-tRNA synthetase